MTGCSPIRFCKLFTADWLTAIGTVATAVIAVVLALWGEEIRRWVIHPKLSLIKLHVGRPDAERVRRRTIHGADAGAAYFFRLAISNHGVTAAHDVQVFLASVERVAAGRAERVAECTPMNLLWSYRGSATLPTLLPKMPPIYCDFVHIEEPKPGSSLPGPQDASLILDVEFPSNTGGHVLGAGTYLTRIILAGANCKPRYYTLELTFPGRWFAEEERMFSDEGLKMRTAHRKATFTTISGDDNDNEEGP